MTGPLKKKKNHWELASKEKIRFLSDDLMAVHLNGKGQYVFPPALVSVLFFSLRFFFSFIKIDFKKVPRIQIWCEGWKLFLNRTLLFF